jgi:hypothetical protein
VVQPRNNLGQGLYIKLGVFLSYYFYINQYSKLQLQDDMLEFEVRTCSSFFCARSGHPVALHLYYFLAVLIIIPIIWVIPCQINTKK